MRERVGQLSSAAVKRAIEDKKLKLRSMPDVEVERPRDKAHGDWSTNVALTLAKSAGMKPADIAKILIPYLSEESAVFASVEFAAPGFINFRLAPEYLTSALKEIERLGSDFGRSKTGGGEKVQVEFVSANPTGPLHVGHGRWAAVGDALANVMTAAGWQVEREFYVNDFGTQMDLFGISVAARYAQLLGLDEPVPEGGYHGAYVTEISQEIIDDEGEKYLNYPPGERHAIFRQHAEEVVIEHIKKVLTAFGVNFDVWFSERTLHASGALTKTIRRLRKQGHVYELDGAVWLKTTAFGDDKDRVLIRENGQPTYFAADIAYHADKFARGFNRVINIWGSDHHGYVARMKAAVAALGFKPNQLEVIIGQFVNLYRDGEPVRMSKRTGEIVTFEELLDEVGADIARYMFLTRSTDSPVDFDIELAKRESQDNPVYYVQYAHARISSILKHAKKKGVALPEPGASDTSLLTEESELELVKQLLSLKETIEDAAFLRAPYRLTKYAEETAAAFHAFYTKCRVVTEDEALTAARLTLARSAQIVLKNTLTLLGVSAPESM